MQKWQIELYGTPIWLLQTFFGVVIVGGLLVLSLKNTYFGKQFYQVIKPCIDKNNASKIIALMVIMLVLLLLEVRFSVLNTFFYNGLYSALEKKQLDAFWFFAGLNALLLVVRIINGVIDQWFEEVFKIRWLERFNQALLNQWLSHKHYYHLQMSQQRPDNIDQRIQQDAQDFITTTVEFVRGMINSVVSAIEFTIVLWGLSGLMVLFGFEIPKGMVFFVFIFAILATFGAMWIGNPLIKLNFDNERLNGNYRFSLIRIRNHAESIAFYDGEKLEKQNLQHHFKHIIDNRWKIVYRSLGLNSFNNGLTQGVQLLPLMLQAPRFFAGQATIGDMHQTVQAFNRLQRALSFFRNFYEEFTAYQARLERLDGFFNAVQNQKPTKQAERLSHDDGVILDNVGLYLADGKPLFTQLNLQLKQGDSLLIKGLSGCGKTSLLRLLANLWRFDSEGRIYLPHKSDVMFVPQRPYLPQGTLKQAICYPDDSFADVKDDKLLPYLALCRLDYLQEKLNQTDDWQQRLSPGEQQRIAFLRVLLAEPKVLLMDEVTSALDEMTEAHLYQLVKTHLPNVLMISVGHRNTLTDFHQQTLSLDDKNVGFQGKKL